MDLGNKAGLAKGHQPAADSHGGWLWLLVSRLVVFSGVIFLALLRAVNLLCAMRPPGRSGIFFCCEMAVGLCFFSTALTHISLSMAVPVTASKAVSRKNIYAGGMQA